MQMKQYLLETFRYNDYANKKTLEKIKQAPENEQCVRFFSHLINSQKKWMARIQQDPDVFQMSWWDPAYKVEELEDHWNASLKTWLDFLESRTEEEILAEVEFTGVDGSRWAARLNDIALQLNYHSIHHRAQIQFMLREKGLEPDFVDYIGTVYRKFSSVSKTNGDY